VDPRIRTLLRDDWDDLEPYVPVKPLDVLAAEIGVPVDRIVKLDANENLYGPHPAVRAAIEKAGVHIYPDPGQARLRQAIAAYAGVDPRQVVAGSGADDLLDVIIRAAGRHPVVNNTPTFGMYEFLARVNGADVVEVPRGEAFGVDLEGNARAVAAGARVVFVTSPNNPTGNPLSEYELRGLLALDALVVVDEAYVEFSGGGATDVLEGHPNLVLVRTFSKWAGLAGLRAGYALCHPDLAAALMTVKQPYNVSVVAEAAAIAAIEHRAEIFETVRCIVAERERLSALLGELGWLRPLPSQANFILCEVRGRDASRVAAALRARGVLVRYYHRPELRDYIRISAGRPEDTDRLMAELRSLEDA
jgi:histidinol-phosphate aminotransferase